MLHEIGPEHGPEDRQKQSRTTNRKLKAAEKPMNINENRFYMMFSMISINFH